MNDPTSSLIEAVWNEHGRAMLTYATRLLGERSAAEDIVQEALVRIWRQPDALVNGRGSVRGWVLTIVRNLVIDRARARSRRPAEVADAADHPPVVGDHSDAVLAAVDAVAAAVPVAAALAQLSDEHRAVLIELHYRGSTMSEAASHLGIPVGTVKSRAYYGLKALREILRSPDGRPASGGPAGQAGPDPGTGPRGVTAHDGRVLRR